MPESESQPAILVRDLEKFYPPTRNGLRAFLQPFERATRAALQGVSFEVHQGEAVALLGANGAGKSTLLRILATLLLPTRGRALVAGHDVSEDSSAVRRNLGYHAGSDQGFYPRMTGRENLLFFAQLNRLSRKLAIDRLKLLAEQLDLNEGLGGQVRTLSSGTIQRLSLARALMHRPRVLLLDEPTRSLDAVAAAEFRHFFAAELLRNSGTAVLFASHALSEIQQLAHRVAVLHRGKLLALDSVQNLLAATDCKTLEQAFFQLTGAVDPAAKAEQPQ